MKESTTEVSEEQQMKNSIVEELIIRHLTRICEAGIAVKSVARVLHDAENAFTVNTDGKYDEHSFMAFSPTDREGLYYAIDTLGSFIDSETDKTLTACGLDW